MRPSKHDPGRPVIREEVERRLARRIRIWAETWKRCPKKGCRRTGRCLNFDDCAGVSKEPYWPSEEDQRRYFRPLREALRAIEGGRPKYDPDAHVREQPMQPAPKRC